LRAEGCLKRLGGLCYDARQMRPFESKFANPRRPQREGRLVTVGRVEDLPEGRGATVELAGGKELALYNVGGRFYCVENFCPHKGAPLADCPVSGQTVTCDWHGWRFDLQTGACLNRVSDPLETYEVVIEDGLLKISV
jgi:nitrite reductase/ring-hydroxylating ferredoxin subunit